MFQHTYGNNHCPIAYHMQPLLIIWKWFLHGNYAYGLQTDVMWIWFLLLELDQYWEITIKNFELVDHLLDEQNLIVILR